MLSLLAPILFLLLNPSGCCLAEEQRVDTEGCHTSCPFTSASSFGWKRAGGKWKLAHWGGSRDDPCGHCKILGGRIRRCENCLGESLLVGIICVSSSRATTCPSGMVVVNQKKVAFGHPYSLNSYLFKRFAIWWRTFKTFLIIAHNF